MADHFDWLGANSSIDIIRVCPHTSIGAINGFAVTGELELDLWCDFLITGQRARFGDTRCAFFDYTVLVLNAADLAGDWC